jgi:hypothetical protein
VPYKDPTKRAAQKRRWRAAKKAQGIHVPSGTRIAWSERDTEKINETRRAINAAKFSGFEFVAWDGEGVGHPRNRYIMLSNSKRQALEGNDLSQTPKKIFDFLLENGSKKGQVNVIFGGGYDFTHWIMALPEGAKRTLYQHNKVIWDKYFIEYVPRKMFRIVTCGKKEKQSVTVWDVIGFFQCTFVLAISTWLKDELPAEQLQMIAKMKGERGAFTADNKAAILEYNFQECELLARLMTKLRDLLQADPDNPGNIKPWIQVNRWDGAGAVASALFQKVKINVHVGSAVEMGSIKGKKYPRKDYHYENTKHQLEVEHALRSAFFGGRIECFKKGRANQPGWNVDLKSAYPWGMINLPSFALGGKWVHVTRYNSKAFGVWRTKWNCGGDWFNGIPAKGHTIFPLPFRTLFGSVHFSQAGEGWYHTVEVNAAKADKRNTVEVFEGWVWQPSTSEKPFAFVPEYFDQRIRLQSVKHPAEKVIKLGLNSLYGKTAQTLGSEFRGSGLDEDGDEIDKIFSKVSPYFNLAWAGAITASCRAVMYTEAIKREADIIMIQTDGLFGLGKTPPYKETGKLGSFEVSTFKDIIVVQAGVYYTDPKGNGFEKAKTRGFSKSDVSPQQVLEAWERGQKSITYKAAPRFVTMGACITKQSDTFENLAMWISQDRKLDLFIDTKRAVHDTSLPLHKKMFPAAERGSPYVEGVSISEPYNPKWRAENSEDVWRRNTEPAEEGADFIVNGPRTEEDEIDPDLAQEIAGAADVFAELRNIT